MDHEESWPTLEFGAQALSIAFSNIQRSLGTNIEFKYQTLRSHQ